MLLLFFFNCKLFRFVIINQYHLNTATVLLHRKALTCIAVYNLHLNTASVLLHLADYFNVTVDFLNLNTATVLLHPPDGRPVSSRAYNLNTASVLLQRTSTVNGHLRAMKFKYSYCSSSTVQPISQASPQQNLNTTWTRTVPWASRLKKNSSCI